MNIIENIKEKISAVVISALESAIEAGELTVKNEGDLGAGARLEIPKDKQYGDFASNIALVTAKNFGMPPRRIAETIVSHITPDENIKKAEVAGAGFINFYLTPKYLYEVMDAIEKMGADYGSVDLGKGQSVMVEFVSANPTGPMHMGNARGGALGDCMASVLQKAGYKVSREFYINDAGNQIEKFGASLEARYIQQLRGEDAFEFPEDGYKGSDITERAIEYIDLYGDGLLGETPEKRRAELVSYALEKNIDKLKTDLKKYRIEYDVWFRESELHRSGAVESAIAKLKERGYTYEKENALWLSCTKLGLEKDEVLVRANGIPTYFAADIAYHINKLEARGFDRAIDVWGADHHGHVARMKSALSAAGLNSDRFEVVLMQLVRLTRDGEVVRMSKRTGKAITLTDLFDEISVDAARFFFNMRAAGSHLDFDLELAKRQDSDNPVYYVQYAHARICSIVSRLAEDGIDVPGFADINPARLNTEEELALLKKLCDYPEEIRAAAESLEPSKITRYVIDLSTAFHSFYNACRVKVEDDRELMDARLKLADSVRSVIRGILEMLKITAPEKM